MNVARTSKIAALALLLSGAGCGSGTVGPLPAEAEADQGAVSAETALHASRQAAFGDPIPGLTQGELDRFKEGKDEFAQDETPEEGLGPVFNDTSCARCHSDPAVGGSNSTLETRFGRLLSDGRFDPLANAGGSLIQVKGIGQAGKCNFTGETVPPEANLVSQRRTTPLFGLGLVDAVPESTFHYIARIEAELWPSEAGRTALVHDIAGDRTAVGRFGWKNQVPTIHQFSGDAYLNEMGVTSPEFPNENCPNGDCSLLACNPLPTLNDDGASIVEFTDFMVMLAAPPRKQFGLQAFAGRRAFHLAGCSHCHWDTLRTGDSTIGALGNVTFHPYSDFLLHDMGSLGDGIELGDAKGAEFRTAPLWGVSSIARYLHDGRARTIREAILAHDGQGRRARERFAQLPQNDQDALLAFVASL